MIKNTRSRITSMGDYIPKMKNAKIAPQDEKKARSRITLMGDYIPKMKNTKITPQRRKKSKIKNNING